MGRNLCQPESVCVHLCSFLAHPDGSHLEPYIQTSDGEGRLSVEAHPWQPAAPGSRTTTQQGGGI